MVDEEDVYLHARLEEMAYLYLKGYSSGAVGEKLGVSGSTVCRNLKKAGIQRRPKGQKFMVSPEYVEIARRMRADGVRWTEVSAHIGFSIRQLQFYLNGK